MLEVTVLGCGFSLGVPVLSCGCPVCSSEDPLNIRSRSALLLKYNNNNILVDFGPDIRNQLLQTKITSLTAAILTHDHADHSNGIDDLRVFSNKGSKPLPIYGTAEAINSLKKKYQYLQNEGHLNWQTLAAFNCKLTLSGLDFQFFRQHHGNIDSLGIRIGNFVYSNDISSFPDESEQYLYNIDYWVLDCIAYNSTHAHSGLDQVLKWQEKYNPKQILLTNLGHEIDNQIITEELPKNIKPLYDGYQITVEIG